MLLKNYFALLDKVVTFKERHVGEAVRHFRSIFGELTL